MAFCIRDNYEMGRARARNSQMSSRLWEIIKLLLSYFWAPWKWVAPRTSLIDLQGNILWLSSRPPRQAGGTREVLDGDLLYCSVCVPFNYSSSRFFGLHSQAVQRCGSRFWGAASSTHALIRGTDNSPNFSHFCIWGCSGWVRGMVLPWKAADYLKNRQLVRFRIVWMAFGIRDNHEMGRARARPRQTKNKRK